MTDFRPDRTPLVPPGGVELHAHDMTATFSADVTLAGAQHALARLQQWLPVDGDPSWTIGRLVETNSTGPLRLGYGAWRDLLLGCQFENGRGELITAGGRTVKNVAGYDLTKFMVGQGGVFGRIVTVTTRTYRLPAAAILARFEPDPRRINRLLPTPCRPQWAVLTNDGLWCGYHGDALTLDYYRAALVEHGPLEQTDRPLDKDAADRGLLWRSAGAPDSFRAAVPPARVLDFARSAGMADSKDWSADAAFGVVVGPAPADRRDAIRASAAQVGGNIHFVDAAGRASVEYDPALRDLLGRLKIGFDPSGTLEPLPTIPTTSHPGQGPR